MPIGYRFACYHHETPVRLLHLEADAGMYCPDCHERWSYRELDAIGEVGSDRGQAGAVSVAPAESGALDLADAG